eukprot:2820004-Prymnesium_polylepis.1
MPLRLAGNGVRWRPSNRCPFSLLLSRLVSSLACAAMPMGFWILHALEIVPPISRRRGASQDEPHILR